MSNKYSACKAQVFNRGVPPNSFLDQLVHWAKQAPKEIFAKSDNYDIYSSVESELGPWTGDFHRRAVMLEVLRVVGGFESCGIGKKESTLTIQLQIHRAVKRREFSSVQGMQWDSIPA